MFFPGLVTSKMCVIIDWVPFVSDWGVLAPLRSERDRDSGW